MSFFADMVGGAATSAANELGTQIQNDQDVAKAAKLMQIQSQLEMNKTVAVMQLQQAMSSQMMDKVNAMGGQQSTQQAPQPVGDQSGQQAAPAPTVAPSAPASTPNIAPTAGQPTTGAQGYSTESDMRNQVASGIGLDMQSAMRELAQSKADYQKLSDKNSPAYDPQSASMMLDHINDVNNQISKATNQAPNQGAAQVQQPSQAAPQNGGQAPAQQSGNISNGSSQTPSQGQGWSVAQIRAAAASNVPGLQKVAELEQARQLAAQTDIGKLLAQLNIDPNSAQGQQIIRDHIAKENYIAPTSIRGQLYADASGLHSVPAAPEPGFINIKNPDGTWSTQPVQNGLAAVQAANAAKTAGVNSVTPGTFVGKDGITYATNQLALATGTQANGAPIQVAPTPGQNAFNEANATASSGRYNTLIAQAQDSPTRINVLDNIVALSQKGVATGPGSDWQNNIKGMVANIPAFKDTDTAKNWQGSVADYQELTKFMNQNAQRAWSAAGGTGTDAQLEQQVNSNVSNKMFPQAVQAMANWAKAGELALQAKASAAQQQNITTPAQQTQFENTWRQNFNPVIFQMLVQSPAQQNQTIAVLKANGSYDTVMQQTANIKQMGGTLGVGNMQPTAQTIKPQIYNPATGGFSGGQNGVLNYNPNTGGFN